MMKERENLKMVDREIFHCSKNRNEYLKLVQKRKQQRRIKNQNYSYVTLTKVGFFARFSLMDILNWKINYEIVCCFKQKFWHRSVRLTG